MDFATSSKRCNAVLAAVCGAVLTVGVCWAFSSAFSAFSTSSAYVSTQPATGLQTGALPVRSVRQLNKGAPPLGQATPAPAATVALAAAPVDFVGAVNAATPWLALVAILLQWKALVNLLSSFFNYLSPAEVAPAAPVPAYNAISAAAAPSEELAVRTRSNQMDEVARAIQDEQARRKQLSPKQVVLDLQRGNARFWSGMPDRPELSAMERRALIIAQAPTVCILSCSDSRVPVELLFDQGPGSIFVVRVAGNILDASAVGSIEFAVKYLGVKVLLVMGHEGCGAVKGALTMSPEDLAQQPQYLKAVLENIKGNLPLAKLGGIRDGRAQDREAIVVNATSQVKKLQQNPLIAERVSDGSLLVCGAFYEITSGIVDFFSLDKNGLVVDI